MASSELTRLSAMISPRMLRDLPAYNPTDTLAALRDAAREFCRRSECWNETLASFDVVADQQQYYLAPAAYANVARIKQVRLLSTDDVTNGTEGTIVRPAYYRLVLPDVLRFETDHVPSTSVTDGMVVDALLFPRFDSEEAPRWIIERYADAIIGKAMHDLLRGSFPDKAAFYLQQYNTGLSVAMPENIEDITP